MKKYLYLFLALLLITACGEDEPQVPVCPSGEEDTHILLGIPSHATHNENNFDDYLIQLPEYALSYNSDKGTPNWVSWHLDSEWMDVAERQDNFRSYPDLPASWHSVTKSSYTNSGFDRGHNCPSADRTCSEEGNSATFYMINMIPQAPNHNRVVWAAMEDFSRELVNQGKEVYTIMGCYGEGGEGSNGMATTIDNGEVTVPASIWKIMLILDNGSNDLIRIYDDTRIIAVDIPNNNTVSTGMDWHDYMTTIDDIETKTGFDFLDVLPNSLQNTLEQKVDAGPW